MLGESALRRIAARASGAASSAGRPRGNSRGAVPAGTQRACAQQSPPLCALGVGGKGKSCAPARLCRRTLPFPQPVFVDTSPRSHLEFLADNAAVRSDIALFNTNQVNRGGSVFPIPVLLATVDQAWASGTAMFLSHDMQYPIGWSNTLGLLIAPQLVGVLGATHLPETAEEREWVGRNAKHHLYSKLRDVGEAEERLLSERIGVALQPDTRAIRREAVCVVEEGLAARLFPHLFSTTDDKYALTDLRALRQVRPGVFEVDGLLLFAHRYFRRSQSVLNSLNAEFLTELGECAGEENGLSVKIALDPDTVGLAGTETHIVELQYWWGPKFNDDLAMIQLDVTQHQGNELMRVYHGIRRMEFWWHEQNDITTLEAEEVLDRPSLGISDSAYAARYVHSMLDPRTARPYHLDGAVRVYDDEQMLERVDAKISEAGRSTRYTKLWRIDGDLDVPRWKTLISHFYRDNQLVGEYFGGVDTVLLAEDADAKPTAPANPLPRRLEKDEGTLLSVCFAPLSTADAKVDPVCIGPTLWLGAAGEEKGALELQALDFVKSVRRHHPQVALPLDFVLLDVQDADIALPRIDHRGPDAVSAANATLLALREFLGDLSRTQIERFVTAEIAIEWIDRVVIFCFAGHPSSLCSHLDQLPPLPHNAPELATWAERAHDIARELFPLSCYAAELLHLISPAGAIRMRRLKADIESDAQGQLRVIAKEESALARAIEDGVVALAPVYEVRHLHCGQCGVDYAACNCRTLHSGDSAAEIKNSDLIGCFWTKSRSAPPHSHPVD